MHQEPIETSDVEVTAHFVRERNALATRAHFGPLYVDHYLHLMQHGMQLQEHMDATLKDALAALCLHLAARPWDEEVAWTVNFQKPRFNLFVTGNCHQENVVGRAFTKDIKAASSNRFIAQVRDGRAPTRQSMVEFQGTDFFAILEHFFQQSEQRLARLFREDEETFVMITAQPDCDLAWLRQLDDEAVRRLSQEETLKLLETRVFRFSCGCDLDRILPTLATLTASLIDDLYGDDDSVTIQCPRCGARFPLSRATLEAYLQDHGSL